MLPGTGIPCTGLGAFGGGILGLQTKGAMPGQGLHRGCLAPRLLIHLPWMCRGWSLRRSGSPPPAVRAGWRGGWGSGEQDGSCRSFVPSEVQVQSSAQLPGGVFAVLGLAFSSRAETTLPGRAGGRESAGEGLALGATGSDSRGCSGAEGEASTARL